LTAALANVAEADLTVRAFIGASEVTELIGPQRPDQVAPLTISHSVKHDDPALAATLADSWAQATVETVQQSYLASLSLVKSTTLGEMTRLEEHLTETEETWEAFQAQDKSTILKRQLEGLSERVAAAEVRLDDLNRWIAASRARQQALSGQLAASAVSETPTDAIELSDQLTLLESAEGISEALANQIRFLLGQQPGEGNGLEQDVLALLARTRLQNEVTGLVGQLAEQENILGQLEAFEQQADTLLLEIARLDQERSRLSRELNNARKAYTDVVTLEPVINYLTELAPSNSRVLKEASIPSDPIGPRRMLNTALATVLAGMMALLYVFLREAVREPATAEITPATSATQAEPQATD
ncbi:MAG: hypothetical protein JSV66_04855, partial [Trueperaceae bacterium]